MVALVLTCVIPTVCACQPPRQRGRPAPFSGGWVGGAYYSSHRPWPARTRPSLYIDNESAGSMAHNFIMPGPSTLRCCPQLVTLREQVLSGILGVVHHVDNTTDEASRKQADMHTDEKVKDRRKVSSQRH
jgi:hypothetical protein